MKIDLGDCETYNVLADVGSFLWNENFGADDPAFKEATLATMDLPDSYPTSGLVFKPIAVEMGYALCDGDEVVALVFRKSK